jgi:hypothetical protein
MVNDDHTNWDNGSSWKFIEWVWNFVMYFVFDVETFTEKNRGENSIETSRSFTNICKLVTALLLWIKSILMSSVQIALFLRFYICIFFFAQQQPGNMISSYMKVQRMCKRVKNDLVKNILLFRTVQKVFFNYKNGCDYIECSTRFHLTCDLTFN